MTGAKLLVDDIFDLPPDLWMTELLALLSYSVPSPP